MTSVDYLVGVDGGGTGTRLRLADAHGVALAQGRAGPSSLAHGIPEAWAAILSALSDAFDHAGGRPPPLARVALGVGLAGVNVPDWRARFQAGNPGFARLCVDTDAYTTWRGALGGAPGAILALGTGSVGLVVDADGQRRQVGGWGFPASDEGSGAWLGLHAVQLAQQVLDGRAAAGAFSQAVITACGGSSEGMRAWVGQASQTRFAALAPLVVQHGPHDAAAHALLLAAGVQVGRIAHALDPRHDQPIALCGGLAEALHPWLPADLRARAVAPQGDSAQGALALLLDSPAPPH